jgi:hypothetical protein
MISIWLDDVRPIREGFTVHVKTAEMAIAMLETKTVEKISVDNDLGDGQTEGYKVVDWIEDAVYHGRIPPIQVTVHSDNSGRRGYIEQAIKNIDRMQRDRAAGIPVW